MPKNKVKDDPRNLHKLYLAANGKRPLRLLRLEAAPFHRQRKPRALALEKLGRGREPRTLPTLARIVRPVSPYAKRRFFGVTGTAPSLPGRRGAARQGGCVSG